MSDPQAPGGAGRPPASAGPPAGSPPWVPAPTSAAPASGPGAGTDGERPPPRPAALLSAGAGLLLIASLVLFLGEIGGNNQRFAGTVVSLLFQAIGVGLLLLARDQRSANAGVALTGVAVVPLLVYLFVDVRNPENTIGDVGDFTNTATLILLAAATLWLAAYFLGPGRRYGFFLGAALVAVWLVAVVQIVDDPLGDVFDPFTGTSTFEPVDPGFDDQFFEPSPPGGPSDPSATLGWVSLVFGGAYLGLAGWRDRTGDRRQATVLFAVAIVVLTFAVSFLSEPLDAEGAATVAIALGVVGVWLGTAAGRRFTSWYATVAAVIGVLVLVASALEDSARAMAAVLLAVGVVLAAAAARFGDAPSPLRPDDTGGPGGPAPQPPGAPWSSAAPPWAAGPPTTGAAPPPGGYAPPPGATPWTSPGAGPASPPRVPDQQAQQRPGSATPPPAADPWAPPPETGPTGPADRSS